MTISYKVYKLLRLLSLLLYVALGSFVGTLMRAVENDQLGQSWWIGVTVLAAIFLTALSSALEMVNIV